MQREFYGHSSRKQFKLVLIISAVFRFSLSVSPVPIMLVSFYHIYTYMLYIPILLVFSSCLSYIVLKDAIQVIHYTLKMQLCRSVKIITHHKCLFFTLAVSNAISLWAT